jgi:uncharacterized protein (TIGR02246 family)
MILQYSIEGMIVMRNRIGCAALLASIVVFAGGQGQSSMTPSQRSAIEKAVAERHAQTLRDAERLDLDKAIASMLDTEKGAFISDGKLLLTRKDVYETFKQAYAGLEKQQIKVAQQNVIVLAPDIAILVGEGTSAATTKDGRTFGSRWAETVVYVLRDDEWKVIHAHQSLPRR